MTNKNFELDYTFNYVIEKGVYHFDIILRDYESFNNHVIGWAIVNVNNNKQVYKVSKCLNSLIPDNDINVFIEKMASAAKDVYKTISDIN